MVVEGGGGGGRCEKEKGHNPDQDARRVVAPLCRLALLLFCVVLSLTLSPFFFFFFYFI